MIDTLISLMRKMRTVRYVYARRRTKSAGSSDGTPLLESLATPWNGTGIFNIINDTTHSTHLLEPQASTAIYTKGWRLSLSV